MSKHSRFGPVVAALVIASTISVPATASFADGLPGGPPVPGPSHPGAAVVQVAQSTYGPVLVTGPGASVGAGLALYEFSGDAFSPQPPLAEGTAVLQFHCTATNTTARFSSGSSTKPTACTTPWPPLMASGSSLVAGPGVSQSGLSVASATSGYTTGQVEYYGHPLYTFVKDTVGTFNGENYGVFGGIFWLVSPRDGLPDAGTATLGSELTASGPALNATEGNGLRTVYMLSYDTPGTAPSAGLQVQPAPKSTMGSSPSSMGRPGPAMTPPGSPETTCVGACTAVWPPLLTTGRPITGPGVDPQLVGVFRRPDGTMQVTYDGSPLYMYFGDQAPGATSGETNGQYFLDNEALGVWYEVAPQGGPQAGAAFLTAEASPNSSLLGVESSAFPPLNPEATVYTLSSDTSSASSCTGTCAKYWPPVLTSLPPRGASGVDGTIGTIQRPDGTFQVTYNGKPLYFFSKSLTVGAADGSSIVTPFGTFSVVTP